MDEGNPILSRMWRGDGVESVHRGAWVMVRADGSIVHAVGDADQLVYGRSSTKSFQALPLIETGAADQYELGPDALATALASHSGEPIHLDVVADTLGRIGLDEGALRCGPQRPFDSGLDAPATRLTNNCSGKHAGFLAVSQYLGADPALYLDPDSDVQCLVLQSVADVCGVDADQLGVAIDGCSAPTFRLPLRSLATGIARIANPAVLGPARAEAARRLTAAARTHPALVAGTHDRICTDLLRVTDGRLFAKTGAEAVYVVGVVGGDRGVAIKIDDGSQRGFEALLIRILHDSGLIDDTERGELDRWGSTERTNRDGLVIGEIELTNEAVKPLL